MCLTLKKDNLAESLKFPVKNANLNVETKKTIKVYKQYYRTTDSLTNGLTVKSLHRYSTIKLKKDQTIVSSREVNPKFNGFENRLSQWEIRNGSVHEGFHAWDDVSRAVYSVSNSKTKRTGLDCIVIEFEGHIDHFVAKGCNSDLVFSRLTPKAILGYSTKTSTIFRKPTKAMLKAFNGPKKKSKT